MSEELKIDTNKSETITDGQVPGQISFEELAETTPIDNSDITEKSEGLVSEQINTDNNEEVSESKLGQAILGAAERISGLATRANEKLEANAERREIAKEKLKAIGSSAIKFLRSTGEKALKVGVDAFEITLGMGILGAEAVGNGAKVVGNKIGNVVENAVDNTKYRVETTIDRTKSAIDDKREQISDTYVGAKEGVKLSINEAKEKVGAKVDAFQENIANKIDSADRYVNNKVEAVRDAFAKKKNEAMERKQQRAEKRDQKKNEKEAKEAEFARLRAEAEQRRQLRRQQRSQERHERSELAKNIIVGIGVNSIRKVSTTIDRAKVSGAAARSAWAGYSASSVKPAELKPAA